MEAKNEDSDDSEYQTIFAALDELKFASLKTFFTRHSLEDDVLFLMKSEEELRKVLMKDLSLSYGKAFKFSRHWYNKYHKHKEMASDTPAKKTESEFQSPQPEKVQSEATTVSGNLHEKNVSGSDPKETEEETRDSVALDKIKTQQRGKKGLFGTHSTLEQPQISLHAADDFTGGIMLKEGLADGEQRVAAQNGKSHSDGDNQSVHINLSASKESQEPNTETDRSRNRAGEVQSNTGHKHPSKGAVSIDSTQGDDSSKLENEHKGSIGTSFLSNRGDINNNYKTEETSATDTEGVASQSSGLTFTEEPKQSVQIAPFGTDCTQIDGGSIPVPIPSNSSMPQISEVPNLQNDGPKKQNYPQVVQSVEVSKCIRRPFGVKVDKNISYQEGCVLDAEENKEVEFKSLKSAHPSALPWKIMEKAKKFICACLNADSKGIIYFGVGDSQEQGSKFRHGEVIGLEVENLKDDITKAFQFVLDDHIKSDAGPLQKGGEQNCINIHFVPVKSEGNRCHLYVIEIEVFRDWRFCKDNVYYSKHWTERPGGNKDFTEKNGLNDLYKIKGEFGDVAVRTNGASTCVKQHEVKRQVREPLMTKYEEWKRETKSGDSESVTVEHNPDDADFKMFSTTVRDRLRDLNCQEYHYILVANKVPPQYRGTPRLSFLQNIPWVAVFDLFDAASKKDGLHFICNEMTDARRANIKTLDDFKDVSSDWMTDKDCPFSTRGTTWILQLETLQDKDWITGSAKDCFYRALSAYKQCFLSGKLIIVILGLGENAIMEMSDIAESCFSILGGDIARKCVSIISESNTVSDAFIKASKLSLRKQLQDCSITDISWDLLKEIVREMVGPTEFQERGATTKLPFFMGQKEVLNKVIHSWDDLEVYCPEPRLASLTEDIEKARDAFYKGAQVNQINLFHNHSIQRTLEEEIVQNIEKAVKSLGKADVKTSSDRNCYVKTVTVPYEPGSGATTLCRRILWNKRKDYRCAVVKLITKATDFQIEQFQGIGYDETKKNYSPAVLVLVDNFPEVDTLGLSERLIARETKCVIIATYPVETTVTKIDMIKPLRQLDENEMSLVKNIIINITQDRGRRKGAEEVLEREKRFIWFGLELFGRDYDKIEERLQNHVKSTLAFLGDSNATHEKLLNFCCFLHFYSNGADILPHSVVVDILYEASDETDEDGARKICIHDEFGGLLLEGFNETHGYFGWRPAHSLVSEVVKSRMNVEEIAVQLLENAEKGKAYANIFLREQLFQIFFHRTRVSNLVSIPQEEETPEDNIGSDIETDDRDCYESRTRYSLLILDILSGDNGHQRTLELLITICQKVNQTKYKAYAWQQLARFMGHEMRFNQLERGDVLFNRLYDAMNSNKVGELQLPMPETGIKAAHMAVDIAIGLEPNYINHYTTKGLLYVLQLRGINTEDGDNLVSSMPDIIDMGRKALDVYDQSIKRKHGFNFYALNGKIEVIVLLLKLLKALPCFCLKEDSFTMYLEVSEIPREMEELLSQEDHNFIQGLGRTTLELLNNLFKDAKYGQLTTCDENRIRNLRTASVRACKLRREFYDVTGFDRSKLVDDQGSSPILSQETQDLRQQVVQDILFKNDETSYSGWSKLDNEVISSIYRLLKPLCQKGYGNKDAMLIFSKACLRLRREDKPPVEELNNVVQKWVQKFPDSEWAHLFNYMIHFPIPNGSLAAYNSGTFASMKKCWNIAQKRTGWRARKSGAEYFLGKGTGLTAIVSRQEFPELEKKSKTKTDFWRSREVSETLVRVQGQKVDEGVVAYHGIQLRFDNKLYPNESKDDLWFYVGFSVAGPYAFDPIGKDMCSIITCRKLDKRTIVTGASNASRRKPRGPARRKPRELASGIQRYPDVTDVAGVEAANVDDFPDENSSPCSRSSLAVTASPVSYASALKNGEANQENQITKSDNEPPGASASQKGSEWPSIKGTQDKKTRVFQSQYLDGKGRLHHGTLVLRAFKSSECRIHTSTSCQLHDIDRCTFAHSWRGDKFQFVCTRCTEDNKRVCKEIKKHHQFIWNLGLYRTEDGKIWKDDQEHSQLIKPSYI